MQGWGLCFLGLVYGACVLVVGAGGQGAGSCADSSHTEMMRSTLIGPGAPWSPSSAGHRMKVGGVLCFSSASVQFSKPLQNRGPVLTSISRQQKEGS